MFRHFNQLHIHFNVIEDFSNFKPKRCLRQSFGEFNKHFYHNYAKIVKSITLMNFKVLNVFQRPDQIIN